MVQSRVAAVAVLALFAVSSAYSYSPKCTGTGDRCAGAPGKPYVEYAPCCDEGKVCASDSSLGWGRFCIDKPMYYGGEKCYNSGERCMGAPNKPYVDYYPCCDGSPCVEDKAMGWGGFCKATPGYYAPPMPPKAPKGYYPMSSPEPEVPEVPEMKGYGYGYGYNHTTTTPPTTAPPTPPYKKGYGYGYGYKHTTPAPPTPPSPSPEPKYYY